MGTKVHEAAGGTVAAVVPRGAIVACVLVATAMVAMELTVVATVMPQIVAALGGMKLYSWVFSAFVLTQTAMTVVFGKLADARGRRPVILAGLWVFALGSLLAGAAGSMTILIVGRLLQGIGAGAITPVTLTIIADLYPARERGRVQGWLASVWAVAAVIGPLAGAAIVHVFAWPWVFWINVPIALAAGLGLIRYLPRERARSGKPIDYAGAVLFTLAIGCLLALMTNPAAASAARLTACAVGFIGFAALFVWQERRADDPTISFALWRRAPIAAANGASLITGIVLMGVTTFLPMFVQQVLGRSPVIAGLTLTAIMFGWPVGATLSARLFPRIGVRPTLLVGGACLPCGASLLALLGSESSPLLAGFGSLILGFGMGLVSISSLILVQELVPSGERGSVTASNLFARNLGSTLGAGLLGAIQTAALAARGSAPSALSGSLHTTFLVLTAVAVISPICVLLIPVAATRQVSSIGG